MEVYRMLSNISIRQKMWLILGGFIFIVIIVSIIALQRIGKTEVNIEVIPGDAKVLINKKEAGSGTHYLKPGEYTFSATKPGFKEYSVKLTISNETENIGLVPEPNSQEAYDWLKENPDIQQDRESIGGEMSSRVGQEVEDTTPIIKDLPYIDEYAPFAIDYGSDKSNANSSFLIISDSTPVGRVAALSWMADNGYDPTDFNIRFDDFINPIEGGPR